MLRSSINTLSFQEAYINFYHNITENKIKIIKLSVN